MLTALIILTSITQVILSLFVLLRSRSNLSYRLFFFIGLSSLGWALVNYLTISQLHSTDLIGLVRLTMFFVVIQNSFFYLFARTFPNNSWTHSRLWLAGYLILSVFAAAAALSPYLFTSVRVVGSSASPTPGPAMLIFLLHAGISIIPAFTSFIHKERRAVGVARAQLQILLFASVLIWVVVPITNFALTPLLKTTFFIRFSPLYTLAFAAIIAYAIVSQKLFDIRAAVARSVGYLMIVLSMILVYGIGLFGVINVLFPGPDKETLRQILSVILITPLALLFERTRRFFDRVSTRLFYRNSYDTQEVLDALGEVVVRELEIHRLLHDTRYILEGALQASFIEFALFKDDKVFFEAASGRIPQEFFTLGKHITTQRKEVLVTDEMTTSHPLLPYFHDANVALSLQLKTSNQPVGYILFGAKRSGDAYLGQDKRLLHTVASELAITVQNALRFEQIQNFNLTLQARIEAATRKLRSTNEKLKLLDETKDDFISMASHQLRTPLTSVKGYLSMVLEGDAGKINATQKKMLGQAFISSQRMVFLIADLLNVSRLRTGKFVIEPGPTNLATMVTEEIEQITETAAGKDITLSYDKPKEFPSLMLDETKTRQVIMNFVDNAIYYTPAGGHIRVILDETPTSVELKVVDDGIGVPRAEQHHLFTKFYRAGNARKARPDGTGLGLYMAKKVVLAEGGSIIFESREGKGSTFGFSFPLSKLRTADPVPPSALPVARPPRAKPARQTVATRH